MNFNDDLVFELNILVKFMLSSEMSGLKVHSNADESLIWATERLFEKGLITDKDGGYLTNLGRDAAEHAKEALRILTSHHS